MPTYDYNTYVRGKYQQFTCNSWFNKNNSRRNNLYIIHPLTDMVAKNAVVDYLTDWANNLSFRLLHITTVCHKGSMPLYAKYICVTFKILAKYKTRERPTKKYDHILVKMRHSG